LETRKKEEEGLEKLEEERFERIEKKRKNKRVGK
jgi:hypothetical protein